MASRSDPLRSPMHSSSEISSTSGEDLLASVDEATHAVAVVGRLLETLGPEVRAGSPGAHAARRAASTPGSQGSPIEGSLRGVGADLLDQLAASVSRALDAHALLRSRSEGGRSAEELRLLELREILASAGIDEYHVSRRHGATGDAVPDAETLAETASTVLDRLMHLRSPGVELRSRGGGGGGGSRASSNQQRSSTRRDSLSGIMPLPVGEHRTPGKMPIIVSGDEAVAIPTGNYTVELLLEARQPGVDTFEERVERIREEQEAEAAQLKEAELLRHKMRIAKAEEATGNRFKDLVELPRLLKFTARRVVEWHWFDRFIMLLIVANCVLLALDDPDEDPNGDLIKFIDEVDTWFTVAFTVEMLLKVLGYGFVEFEDSYIRTPWNWLDFFIVVTSLLNLFAQSVNFSGLRTFRVVRPLRTVSKLKGLRVLVSSFLQSVPQLANTMVVLGFYFIVFGIIGMQMWQGLFKFRCFDVATGLLSDTDDGSVRLCGGARVCGEGQFCAQWTENPNGDISSFDNLFWASTTIFQCVTLEGWTDIMYWAEDASSHLAVLYFVLLMFLGAFIVINLTLAVILTNFSEASARQRATMIRRAVDIQTKRSMRIKAIIKHEAHVEKLAKRRSAILQGSSRHTDTSGPDTDEDELARELESELLPHSPVAMMHGEMMDIESGRKKVSSSQRLTRLKELEDESKGVLTQAATATADPKILLPSRSVKRNVAGLAVASSPLSRASSREKMKVDDVPKYLREADAVAATGCTSCQSALKCPSRMVSRISRAAEQERGLSGPRWVYRRKKAEQSWKPYTGRHRELCTSCRQHGGTALTGLARLRDAVIRIIEALPFRALIMLAILLNTVVLASEHHGMSPDTAEFLDEANIVFTVIFAAEMVLKMFGLGLAGYVIDPFNAFDGVIVIISIVELFQDGDSGLSALRIVRIFRVIKLVRYLKSLQMIVRVVTASLPSFGWIALLLLLFCFIYAVLGMQLFGGVLAPDPDDPQGGVPRSNFDSLYWAFLTVFQVLAGEGWNLVMYDVVASSSPASVLFFISWLVLGQFTLLNLFVAVLLDNFNTWGDEDGDESDQDDGGRGRTTGLFSVTPQSNRRKMFASTPRTPALNVIEEGENAEPRVPDDVAHSDSDSSKAPEQRRRRRVERSSRPAWRERHCFVVDPHSRLSKKCKELVSEEPLWEILIRGRMHTLTFDGCVLVLIIASSAMLATETPETHHGVPVTWRQAVEIAFTLLFTAECVLKVLAHGLVLHKGSYLRSGYNVMDFVVVLASLVNLFAHAGGGTAISVLKLARCLRPLRIISRSPGMRTVVHALLQSIVGIANVLLVLGMVWLMFAILGVQLFAGRLHRCTDPFFPENAPKDGVINPNWSAGYGGARWLSPPCNGTWVDENGLSHPRAWEAEQPNFDNIFHATVSVFIVSSGEGWPDLMFRTTDVTALDRSPLRGATPLSALYFVAFVCIGYFFFMNLFVGVMFKNFLRLKREMEDFGFLTPEQLDWLESIRMAAASSHPREPVRPAIPWRASAFDVITAPWFDPLVMALIILNVCTMAATWTGEPAEWVLGRQVLNYVFTTLFAVEAALKIAALKWNEYRRDAWNKFDFTVVVGSLVDVAIVGIDLALRRGGQSDGGQAAESFAAVRTAARVFKILRVLRVLRLARSVRGLRRIIATLRTSAPALANVGSLLLLLFFIYAVIGVFAFGQLEKGQYLNEYANFHSFGRALVTLFRCATGEGWETLMFEAMSERNAQTGPGSTGAVAYFVSFVAIAMFVMLNLFIMIILEDFDKTEKPKVQKKGGAGNAMSAQHLYEFRQAWAKMDPEGTGWIATSELEPLLRMLPPPLGLPINASQRQYSEYLMSIPLETVAGRVPYRATIVAIARSSFGVDLPERALEKLDATPDRMRLRVLRKLHRSARWRKDLLLSLKNENDAGLAVSSVTDAFKQAVKSRGDPDSMAKLLRARDMGQLAAGFVIHVHLRMWLRRVRRRIAARRALEAEAKALEAAAEATRLATAARLRASGVTDADVDDLSLASYHSSPRSTGTESPRSARGSGRSVVQRPAHSTEKATSDSSLSLMRAPSGKRLESRRARLQHVEAVRAKRRGSGFGSVGSDNSVADDEAGSEATSHASSSINTERGERVDWRAFGGGSSAMKPVEPPSPIRGDSDGSDGSDTSDAKSVGEPLAGLAPPRRPPPPPQSGDRDLRRRPGDTGGSSDNRSTDDADLIAPPPSPPPPPPPPVVLASAMARARYGVGSRGTRRATVAGATPSRRGTAARAARTIAAASKVDGILRDIHTLAAQRSNGSRSAHRGSTSEWKPGYSGHGHPSRLSSGAPAVPQEGVDEVWAGAPPAEFARRREQMRAKRKAKD